MYNIAIVGATGVVGREIIKLLEKRNFPIKALTLLASKSGRTAQFRGKEFPVEEFSIDKLKNHHFIFFTAGSKISKTYAREAAKYGVVIDSSSAFRKESDVPLVIPEINSDTLKKHSNLIASPNCTTSIMLMALYPLHKAFQIKRIVAATYQAASGGGKKMMDQLIEETASYLKDPKPKPYGFNLFLHNSPLNDDLYSEEELKMIFETRKILDDFTILVNATCVRVAVLRAHSIALNVEFKKTPSLDLAKKLLDESPGLLFKESPTPHDASFKDEVLWGRLRKDITQEKTIDLWVVGDQLLKGAALNAVQIAEKLL